MIFSLNFFRWCTDIPKSFRILAIKNILQKTYYSEVKMFCAFCDELIKGHAYVYDGEEYCSSECLSEAHEDDIEGDLDKYMEEWEEELEEFGEYS
jgi:hypothetical protein